MLVSNLAMLKGVKALTEGTKIGTNYEYWIIIAWLSLILLGIMFLIVEKVHKMPIFRKYQYSNTIKMMLFISNIKSYVLIKLCRTSGSIHLFKLMGSLQREDVNLHRNMVWDVFNNECETGSLCGLVVRVLDQQLRGIGFNLHWGL